MTRKFISPIVPLPQIYNNPALHYPSDSGKWNSDHGIRVTGIRGNGIESHPVMHKVMIIIGARNFSKKLVIQEKGVIGDHS